MSGKALWVQMRDQGQPAKAKPRKRIRGRSAGEAKRMAEYNRARVQWLADKWCAVFPDRRATQLHHVRGRLGKLLTDQRFWLAVSFDGHFWIHTHGTEARLKGWLCERGDWNKQP